MAAHVSLCGFESAVISQLGSDKLGREALKQSDALNINRQWVRLDHSHPTGSVTVKLENAIPSYTIHEQVAWDHITLKDEEITEIVAANPKAFCFGTLAQRCKTSRKTLNKLLNALNDTLIFFDVNIRQHYWSTEIIKEGLNQTTWLKVNDDEALLLNESLFNCTGDIKDFAQNILKHYPVSGVLVTCGADGSLVFQENQAAIKSPVITVDVVDTIGAGDAFSAAFILALLQDQSVAEAATAGNTRGSMVASKPGAIPV